MSRYFKAKFEEYLQEYEQDANYCTRQIEELQNEIKDLEKQVENWKARRSETQNVCKMLWELYEINKNS